MRHLRILRQQRLRVGGIHQRIFVETADIAQHGRVGQFAAADGAHGLGNVLRGGGAAAALLCQNLRQIAVFHVRHKLRIQSEDDRSNHITLPSFVFENAVAVGKAAFGVRQFAPFLRLYIEAAHAVDAVFHFHAVCADVLHGRCTDGAGNQA